MKGIIINILKAKLDMISRVYVNGMLLISISITFSYTNTLYARDFSGDSTCENLYRPNNIKINISANLLYHPAYVLAYERAVTRHQTATIELGYLQFPTLFRGVLNGVNFRNQYSHSGVKAGAEYRFYLPRENRYTAPHGLYIGPYFSYYRFSNVRTLSISDSGQVYDNLRFKTSLAIYQLGVQAGYQFSMFKNRITLDMAMFGPAAGFYNASLKLDGHIEPNIRSEYVQKLADYMTDNFPVFGEFLKARQVNRQNRLKAFAPGFRYAVYIGFRF